MPENYQIMYYGYGRNKNNRKCLNNTMQHGWNPPMLYHCIDYLYLISFFIFLFSSINTLVAAPT